MNDNSEETGDPTLLLIYIGGSLLFSTICCLKSIINERQRRAQVGVVFDIEMMEYNFSACFNKISIDNLDNTDQICSICLTAYEITDDIYESKACKHNFHFRCINRWLNINPSCPLCRGDVLIEMND